MRYLSLFSGIEAATQAWHPIGWTPVAFSEIEPFPCAVLAHHYPDVPNLGDVTKITEDDIKALGQIDLVVFGSPCQDLSIAGKQTGFENANGDTTRSGLFFTAIKIGEWARKHCGCRFLLWENVPGAFSSNKGRDFAAVVDAMAGLEGTPVPPKGWGNEGVALGEKGMVEWASLDARWFGLAQRRKRVFALTDFGDWRSRPPILLEPEGMRGDTPPSRETRKEVARTIRGDTTTDSIQLGQRSGVTTFDFQSSGEYGTADKVPAMSARDYKSAKDLVAFHSNAQPDEMRFDPHVSASLTCSQNAAVAYAIQGTSIGRCESAGPQGTGVSEEVCFTQTKSDIHGVAYSMITANTGSNGLGVAKELAPTLDRAQPCAIAFAQNTRDEVRLQNGDGSICGALSSQPGMKQTTYIAFGVDYENNAHLASEATGPLLKGSPTGGGRPLPAVTTSDFAVRRLTPKECARLQGFPDTFLDIPFRGKPATDSVKYKALGNSMAERVMRWIGEQLDKAASYDLI